MSKMIREEALCQIFYAAEGYLANKRYCFCIADGNQCYGHRLEEALKVIAAQDIGCRASIEWKPEIVQPRSEPVTQAVQPEGAPNGSDEESREHEVHEGDNG